MSVLHRASLGRVTPSEVEMISLLLNAKVGGELFSRRLFTWHKLFCKWRAMVKKCAFFYESATYSSNIMPTSKGVPCYGNLPVLLHCLVASNSKMNISSKIRNNCKKI